MSLPTTSKPSQMSIRSFFQAKTPKYPPPPSQSQHSSNNSNNDITIDAPTIPLSSVPAAASTTTSTTTTPPQSQPQPQSQSTPHPTSSPNSYLPREASIRAITPADINALRRLNALLLPVSYPEAFYNRAADPIAGRFSRVITWSHDGAEPKPVGGLVCRVEPDIDVHAPDGGPQVAQNLYIQSLCLLSPYRSMGLIAAALDKVVAAVVTDPALEVRTVTAHVWTENEEGLHWYEARGFEKHEPAIKGYYLKLRPDSAWVVQKRIGASVLNALPSSTPPLSRPDININSTTAAVMSLPLMTSQLPPATAAATPPAVSNSAPPPPSTSRPRPPIRAASGQSFQNQRAETEWNDLPADMAPGLLGPPKNGSEPGSGASSRSSSTVRRKRDRSYPAAAFGQ
ncbi:uncharacterized protein TrAtP1_012483 [Trichoderma atroviride]|uniref:N-acetyltransferase domain-containing protein n=1 Tax=Hypocrea atroviridis (strain ATCC 20476 / IMI 206040) TaxID=452589 RepID=G9NPE2_HYPAI|nr:uncharacterized protein TRIATDRAFT_316487 [Trichoderma atroviride IMI 206040]EHK47413.1 hypothetical protein TRIATDRAFT_316487 [Trichoderma atroviride IMI 206040]UKZ71529.1 hypothetical protein TrAtP1_012483 [Trichoderma atroviride]